MSQNAYDRAKRYIQNKDKIIYKSLNTAVYENLNESKRNNRDVMDKLSNCSLSRSPTPTNRSANSKSNSRVSFSVDKNKSKQKENKYRIDIFQDENQLRRRQIRGQVRLDRIKARLFEEKMKDVRYTPDLSKTDRYNKSVSKSVVKFKRQKSIRRHLEKLDLNKQERLQQQQVIKDGCTFKPVINKKSKRLHRDFSALLVPCKVKVKQKKLHKIEHLEL